MPTNPPTITALPTPPDPNDRSTFNARAYPWSVAQQTLATEVAAVAANVKGNADEALAAAGVAGTKAAEAFASQVAAAASAASALNAPGTTATSASTLAVGPGLKSLTLAQTGKAFAVGQRVVVARTSAASTVRMIGYLESANTGTGELVVRVGPSDSLGNGTYSDWTISMAGEGNNLMAPTSSDVGKYLGVVAGPGYGLVAMTGSGGGALSGSQALTTGGSYAVSPTANGQFVTLPDATTLATGAATINLKNAGNFTLGVRNFTGAVLGFLQAGESALVGLAVNASSGGVWVIDFPSAAVSRGQIPSTMGTLMGTVQVGTSDVYLMFGYSVAGVAISFNAQAIDTATGAFGPVATSLAANWVGRHTASVVSLEGFMLGSATIVLDMVHTSTYDDGYSTTRLSGRNFAPVGVDGALNVTFGAGTGHTYSNNSSFYKFTRAALSGTKFAQSHCEGHGSSSYSYVVSLASGSLTKTNAVYTYGAYAVAATATGDALLVPKSTSESTSVYVMSAAGVLGTAVSISALSGTTQVLGPTASGHFAIVSGTGSSSAGSMVKLSISGTAVVVSSSVIYPPSIRAEVGTSYGPRNNAASWLVDGDYLYIGDTSEYFSRVFFLRVDMGPATPVIGSVLEVPFGVGPCVQPWLQADGRLINLYRREGNDLYWLAFEKPTSNGYLGGAFALVKTTIQASGAFVLSGFKRRKFYTKASQDVASNNAFQFGERLLLVSRGLPYSSAGGYGRDLNGPASAFLIEGMNISSFTVPGELLECVNLAGTINTSKSVGLYFPSILGAAGAGPELFGVNR